MKYDFTSILDRKGKDAIAIDAVGMPGALIPIGAPKEGFDVIPMWIADMNFPTCPTITEAIIERASHPAFGYFMPRKEYYEEIIAWHEKRNGVTGLTAECIGYENGVLGCVSSALSACAAPGDAVLVHSPTYVGFSGILNNNGYKIVQSPLKQDKEGVWRMDYEDMEKKLRENHIHTAIFCSPHNPCGRVWEREELEQAMAVYERCGCTVISDEIWSDIIMPGYRHIPTQMVNEWARQNTVGIYAPSKTFNLAGLIGSYHIIYNEVLRDKVRSRGGKSHYNCNNVLSMHALIGAYKSEGYEWVDELCETLAGNIDYAFTYIREHFKGVTTAKPQGTYMMFLDCSDWCKTHGKTVEELIHCGWDVGVTWQDGRPFLPGDNIRINLALPLSRVKEAMDRLDRYVFNA